MPRFSGHRRGEVPYSGSLQYLPNKQESLDPEHGFWIFGSARIDVAVKARYRLTFCVEHDAHKKRNLTNGFLSLRFLDFQTMFISKGVR